MDAAGTEGGFITGVFSEETAFKITSNGVSYINGGNLAVGQTTASEKLEVNGNIKLSETAATTDTDKFVVLDSGVLKYRTGAEVRSDIGAGTSDFDGNYNSLTNTPTTITTDQANAISANTLKVTFPGFGTTAGTALEGNTSLFDGDYNLSLIHISEPTRPY